MKVNQNKFQYFESLLFLKNIQALLGMITKALRSEMHFNRPINYLITPYEAKTIKKVSELEEDASYVACHKNRLIQVSIRSKFSDQFWPQEANFLISIEYTGARK